MKNNLTYVAAGAEGLFDGEDWVFDLTTMPIDYYLINATTFMGRASVETAVMQRRLANNAGKKILCDSGGFQLATETIDHIDPMGVIDVQNRVADIGFILDVPTMRRARGAGAGGLELDASEEYFQQCLKRTQENIRKARDLKKKFQYYAIIQGVTFDQLRRWWEGISTLDTFAGVGTKGVILEQVLTGLFFTETLDIPQHHILGLGAAPRLLLVRYFYLNSRKAMSLITYDNTNHIQYSKYMQVVMPFINCFYNKAVDVENFSMLSGVKIHKENMDEIFFASLRNLYFYGMQNKFLNMLDTPATIKDFVKSNVKPMEQYINCIDDYFEKGIEYVMKKYPNLGAAQAGVKKVADLSSFV